MSRRRPGLTACPAEIHALIFMYGDTEEIFYTELFPGVLSGIPKRLYNLKGNQSFRKILGKTYDYLKSNDRVSVRVYCFVDRESRDQNPPVTACDLREQFQAKAVFEGRVVSVDVFVATQMIESWFFHDIRGIFKFLRTPLQKRKLHKYNPPEKQTWRTLSTLFEQNGKTYIKGTHCKGFVDHLDIKKIMRHCAELRNAIDKITHDFTD